VKSFVLLPRWVPRPVIGWLDGRQLRGPPDKRACGALPNDEATYSYALTTWATRITPFRASARLFPDGQTSLFLLGSVRPLI